VCQRRLKTHGVDSRRRRGEKKPHNVGGGGLFWGALTKKKVGKTPSGGKGFNQGEGNVNFDFPNMGKTGKSLLTKGFPIKWKKRKRMKTGGGKQRERMFRRGSLIGKGGLRDSPAIWGGEGGPEIGNALNYTTDSEEKRLVVQKGWPQKKKNKGVAIVPLRGQRKEGEQGCYLKEDRHSYWGRKEGGAGDKKKRQTPKRGVAQGGGVCRRAIRKKSAGETKKEQKGNPRAGK